MIFLLLMLVIAVVWFAIAVLAVMGALLLRRWLTGEAIDGGALRAALRFLTVQR